MKMDFLIESELFSNIQALTNLGKRISGKNNISICFTPNDIPPYTDSQLIFLPIKFKKDLKGAQGLVAHEGGHIGYGSFEIGFRRLINILYQKYKLPQVFIRNVINIIEDARINLINKDKYPGFYEYIRELTLKEMPHLKERLDKHQDILLYIHLFMEDYEEFNKKPDSLSIKISDLDWSEISTIKKLIQKSLTPSTSMICVNQLCKVLKKYIPSEVNPGNSARPPPPRFYPEDYGYEEYEDYDEDDDYDDEYNEIPNSSHLNYDEIFERAPYLGKEPKLSKTSEELLNKISSLNMESKDLEKLVKNLDDNDVENISKDSQNDKDSQGYRKEDIRELIEIIKDAEDAMAKRLISLEKGNKFIKLTEGVGDRDTIETKIEDETMRPIMLSYSKILTQYSGEIKRMKIIFKDLKNEKGMDNFQTKGRLNSKFIKAVTSDYKFNRCFTRKTISKELRLVILVDISGSMGGQKLIVAKIALVMLCEALESIANIKIVLFTGEYDARNILVKDFNESVNPRKFDKFGCHCQDQSNLDGISLQTEANKLKGNEFIIVISDGQPAGCEGYGLYNAILEISEVRKRFKVFAFSIDANGKYLDKLYGNNWILTNSRIDTDLARKMNQFCNLVLREFF